MSDEFRVCAGINNFSIRILPDGRKLFTLRDAALYITKLPKAEHDAPEWQAIAGRGT